MIKTENPHKASRKALRETGKGKMVNKHELPRDWQEESVAQHTDSMQAVKEKLTHKKRCSVRDVLSSLFSCIRSHHRWLTNAQVLLSDLIRLLSLTAGPLLCSWGSPEPQGLHSLSPELPLESRAGEGHGMCQV